MLMCTKCYSIFKEDNQSHSCYNYGCAGNIVRVDNEIGYLISKLNRKFIKRRDSVRTIFCSSAHMPNQFRSYVVFSGVTPVEDKISNSMNIRDFRDFIKKYVDNISSSIKYCIIKEFSKYNLDTSNISDEPLVVSDLRYTDQNEEPEFKIVFNMFKFKNNMNHNMMIHASNLAVYLFNNVLSDIIEDLPVNY